MTRSTTSRPPSPSYITHYLPTYTHGYTTTTYLHHDIPPTSRGNSKGKQTNSSRHARNQTSRRIQHHTQLATVIYFPFPSFPTPQLNQPESLHSPYFYLLFSSLQTHSPTMSNHPPNLTTNEHDPMRKTKRRSKLKEGVNPQGIFEPFRSLLIRE